ncbi:hypothetical protein DEJ50_07330 [Streptomyces venezuelae]|uniref:Uncharacterized protein n=1 Tax=Streptomyces venezuelae TaxID=54571 RepID=A0A5P2D3G4_STRVZ|nr:hypothetical protein [Streptomyces venezuelae]QES47659.1 hypothetical protein DEJ50_07330 [Streptomyces venezuelae]
MSEQLSREQREEALEAAIAGYIRDGYQVTYRSATGATVAKGKPINHTLHLILTIATCTVWSFVWIALAIMAAAQNATYVLSVDAYGNVQAAKQ